MQGGIVYESFLGEIERLGYGRSSQQQSRAAVGEFISWLGVRRITAARLSEYYAYLSQRPHRYGGGGLSSKTIDGYLIWIRRYCSYLVEEGLLSQHPMSHLHLPKPESAPREILSTHEITQLYAQASQDQQSALLRAMLGVFYGCGLRRSEGEQLALRDVQLRTHLLYVRKGKGGVRRVVPMSGQVREDLLAYAESIPRSNQHSFFINQRGRRMRGPSFDRLLRGLVSKAQINKRISLHCLRHSIATHLLAEGMSLESVRDFLGHKHLETTQLYTRVEI